MTKERALLNQGTMLEAHPSLLHVETSSPATCASVATGRKSLGLSKRD